MCNITPKKLWHQLKPISTHFKDKFATNYNYLRNQNQSQLFLSVKKIQESCQNWKKKMENSKIFDCRLNSYQKFKNRSYDPKKVIYFSLHFIFSWFSIVSKDCSNKNYILIRFWLQLDIAFSRVYTKSNTKSLSRAK